MAGKKRARYDDESLKNLSMKMEIIQKVIADTTFGKSMIESVNKQFLDLHQFRRVLDAVHAMQIHDKIGKKPLSERLVRDYMCNPIEALYGDIYGIHEEDWEEFFIPKDAMESYEYVSKDLTEREQKVIELYYFEEMTLEEVGKVFSVTRDRIRQIIAKAIRKLRHPSRRNILSIGIGEWNRQQEIAKEQERLEEEAMHKAFIERLGKKAEVVIKGDVLPHEALEASISDLELSVRSFNCLKRAAYTTVADVLKANQYELMAVRNLGRRSLTEVVKNTYEYFQRNGMTNEQVFTLRNAIISDKEEDTESYIKFVDTVLKGGNPWL